MKQHNVVTNGHHSIVMEEPTITVNGHALSTAQAMTVRVALSAFYSELITDGLGDDEAGRNICDGYQRACGEIINMMRR